MDAKYYTPTIEDFHVGFECEMKNKKRWVKAVCGLSLIYTMQSSLTTIRAFHYDKELDFKLAICPFDSDLNFFRVKYLDEQDILECGWSLWHKDGVYNILDKEERNWQMHIGSYDNRKDGAIALELYEWITANENVQQIVAYCKNKSELKRLMKQLGITSWEPPRGSCGRC